MPRAIWKGAITFGLVSIPVELHPAEDRKSFKFSLLDKRDLSPVGYKHFNKASHKDVDWSDIIKGYEYEKEKYVVLSDEDFRRANVKATGTIDIQAFVPEGDIPLEYFDSPYYLTPGSRGEKVYALLRETLRSSKRVGIAQVVIRTKQHLAAVVVNGPALMLNTLRYEDELLDTKGLDLPAAGLKGAGVTAKEIALAKRLVDDMAEQWKPGEFKDTYHADLMAIIKQKIKQGRTEEITKPGKDEEKRPSAQVIDLAELLRKSLAKSAAGTKSTATRTAAKRKRA
jgi:DNA end-binding protein Ku